MMRKICGFLFSCLLLASCTKTAPEMGTDEVQALIHKVNQSPMGLVIKVDDADIKTGPLEGHRDTVLITLANPIFSVNSKVFKHLQPNIPEFELPFGMEELSWTYNPSKERLGVHGAKGVKLTFDTSKFIEMRDPQKGDMVPNMKFAYEMKGISFDNYDITPLLGAQDQAFIPVLISLIKANQKAAVSLDGLTLDFDTQDGVNHMRWSVDHAEQRWAVNPEIVAVFMQAAEASPTMSRLLDEGKDLLELGARIKDFGVSLSGTWGDVDANLNTLGVSYSVKPEEARKTFRLNFSYDLGDLVVTGAQQKSWQTWMDINRLNLLISLEGLSPDFIAAYFDLIRTAQSLRTSQDPARQQEIAMQGLALLGKFIKTKPVVSFSLSPLDHALGTVETEGRFQFLEMGPPAGKATVRISNINEMEERIRAEELLPSDKVDLFMIKLEEMFEMDEDGGGILTFEIKEDDPANFYLNGRPQSFRSQK